MNRERLIERIRSKCRDGSAARFNSGPSSVNRTYVRLLMFFYCLIFEVKTENWDRRRRTDVPRSEGLRGTFEIVSRGEGLDEGG